MKINISSILHICHYLKFSGWENFLVVQWLGLHALIAEDQGSIPDQGTKIPQAVQCGQNNNKKRFLGERGKKWDESYKSDALVNHTKKWHGE